MFGVSCGCTENPEQGITKMLQTSRSALAEGGPTDDHLPVHQGGRLFHEHLPWVCKVVKWQGQESADSLSLVIPWTGSWHGCPTGLGCSLLATFRRSSSFLSRDMGTPTPPSSHISCAVSHGCPPEPGQPIPSDRTAGLQGTQEEMGEGLTLPSTFQVKYDVPDTVLSPQGGGGTLHVTHHHHFNNVHEIEWQASGGEGCTLRVPDLRDS